MRIILTSIMALAACVLLTSCASVRVQEDLACRFTEMHEAGKIPGLPPGQHGRLRTEGTRIGQHVAYPFSQKVYVYPQGDSTFYIYGFTKDTSSSQWRLTSASRTFPDGRSEDLKIE